MFSAPHMQNSVLISDLRAAHPSGLRRKSAAYVIASTLRNSRRNSRVSITSIEATHQYLGQDGYINLFPFKNGIHSSNDSFWANNRISRKQSCLDKFTTFLQTFYEKSRIHYLLPIIILVVYSFLGGFIFYSIENPEEQKVLLKKKEYIQREEQQILREVLSIDQRLRALYVFYNSSEVRNQEIRKYRSFAMNRLNKAVYWYVLQVYYLNDQESYKSSLLHPTNPERIWKSHFGSSFGRIFALRNYTQQLSERCWEIGIEMNNSTMAYSKMKKSIDEFNAFTGLQHVLTPTWTFWNSMFLAVTTYSTIGYGNIAPKSKLGKLAAMVYAVIGIPLVLMILHKLGRFFLLCLEHFWNYLVWFMEFVSCVKNAEKLKGRVSVQDQRSGGMPVLLAIGVSFGWMFLCAAIFLKFEKDWDYFKSFYFFFCSLTTIGYGDVTPTNSEDMFIIFGFIIVGLSLVSMCINVIQLKLEELFEELLLTMMEEYDTQAGAGPQIAPKMGMVDLWKMWKRRRRMARPPPQAATDDGANIQPPPNRVRFSDLNLWKIFPFAKRRREVLLHEIHIRFNQLSKSTQTDFCYYEIPLLRHARDIEEESLTEEESEPTTMESSTQSAPSTSMTSSTTNTESSHKTIHVTISTSSSSSSPIFGSSSSSSSYVRRYLPSNHRRHERRPTACSSAAFSVHSAPHMVNYGTYAPNNDSLMQQQYSGSRRWTFFEIGKTPRGAPRGLVAPYALQTPYMYTRRCAKTHETTEMRRLIAEIDSRLMDARSLVSPCSRSVSRASNESANASKQ